MVQSNGVENNRVMERTERCVVRVTGDDAATYLQGQISQDVEQIEVGSSAWSLVLQPNGKFTAWFRLHRIDESEFVIDAEPSVGDALVARLERFKLRTAVEFTVEDGWEMVSVRGDETPPAIDGVEVQAGFVWPGFEGTDLLGRSLGPTPEVDSAEFERARIEATVPRSGVDLDEDTIPAEGGASLIDLSVSFTKGCYTGQELVARINSRGGNVPRPLRTLRADTALRAGASVMADGAEVGTVSSVADSLGLARVLRKVEPGSTVEVDGAAATVG